MDVGLIERLGRQGPPVVLVGVEEHLHRFGKLSDYPQLVPGGIAGSPESQTPEALARSAWQTVRPVLERDRHEAAARFAELSGTEQTLGEIGPVIDAARIGRVDTLFVSRDDHIWGRLPEDADPEVHADRQPGDVELLDRAAMLTLQQSAPVFACPREEMPGDSPVAAILRY